MMDLIWRFCTDSWTPKESITAIVALYGAVIATLNFTWPRIQEWRACRIAIFRALQGEKEAIAEVACRVIKNEWDDSVRKDETFRKRLVSALSMAFVMESSDRAKAYVVAAFEHLARQGCYDELITQLRDIERIFKRYDDVVADRDFRDKRLAKLTKVIDWLTSHSQSRSK